MGSVSALKALEVYDCMQQNARQLVETGYTPDVIFYTDVQEEADNLPSDYAVIRQFNSSLTPKTVSGGVRKQLATLIMELNCSKGRVRETNLLTLEITHYFSGRSFSECDIQIDSVTSNEYPNPSGVKFVVVIDFNYTVRL